MADVEPKESGSEPNGPEEQAVGNPTPTETAGTGQDGQPGAIQDSGIVERAEKDRNYFSKVDEALSLGKRRRAEAENDLASSDLFINFDQARMKEKLQDYIEPLGDKEDFSAAEKLCNKLSDRRWLAIQGANGSGRTWVALRAAQLHLDQHRNDDEQVGNVLVGSTNFDPLSLLKDLIRRQLGRSNVRAVVILSIPASTSKNDLDAILAKLDEITSKSEVSAILTTEESCPLESIHWRPRFDPVEVITAYAYKRAPELDAYSRRKELDEFINAKPNLLRSATVGVLSEWGQRWADEQLSMEWLCDAIERDHQDDAIELLNSVQEKPYALAYLIVSCLLNGLNRTAVNAEIKRMATMLAPDTELENVALQLPFGFGRKKLGRVEISRKYGEGTEVVQETRNLGLVDEVISLFRSSHSDLLFQFIVELGKNRDPDILTRAVELAATLCCEDSVTFLIPFQDHWLADGWLADDIRCFTAARFLTECYFRPFLRNWAFDCCMEMLRCSDFHRRVALTAIACGLGRDQMPSIARLLIQRFDEDDEWASSSAHFLAKYQDQDNVFGCELLRVLIEENEKLTKPGVSAAKQSDRHLELLDICEQVFVSASLYLKQEYYLATPFDEKPSPELVRLFVALLDKTFAAQGSVQNRYRERWYRIYADWIRRGRMNNKRYQAWNQIAVAALARYQLFSVFSRLDSGTPQTGSFTYWDDFCSQMFTYGLDRHDREYVDFLNANLPLYTTRLNKLSPLDFTPLIS